MDYFTVDVSRLAGFGLDLHDLGANFSSNAVRLLATVAPPAGTTGLMASLTPAFAKFHDVVYAAQQVDSAFFGTLGDNLAAAVTGYQATDETNAKALSGEGAGTSGPAQGVTRFIGLQLPDLSAVQEDPYSVRQVVSAGIESIAYFDEALRRAIGVAPAADYLSPLAADWEALQTIGKQIGLLGINDYVASENLAAGTRWLQSIWSGDASEAFGTSTRSLVQTVSGRSADLESLGRIVENGGAVLERLVYNQAMGLAGGLAQPMTFLNFTLPLGVWAGLINQPARETVKSEIAASLDTLMKAAESRHSAMTTMVERIGQALDYVPGETAPVFNASEFEIPEKVVANPGSIRYGYGDNVWWENVIASTI